MTVSLNQVNIAGSQYINLMLTALQKKTTLDTQKIKRNKPKNIKKRKSSNQMGGKIKNKKWIENNFKNNWKTSNKMALNTYL